MADSKSLTLAVAAQQVGGLRECVVILQRQHRHGLIGATKTNVGAKPIKSLPSKERCSGFVPVRLGCPPTTLTCFFVIYR